MNYKLQLISTVNQIRKSYETYNPVTEKEKAETYQNHIRLSVNPQSNPFVNKGTLKSFNVNYIRDNMIAPEHYDASFNLFESGALLLNPETAVYIYNMINAQSNDSVSVSSSPVSSGSFDLTVENTASAQISEGLKYSSSADASVNSGEYALNIVYGGKNNFIPVKLSGTETHGEVMSKIASSINNSGIGITASVQTDTHNTELKYILLSADKTGAVNSFTVSDLVGDLQSRYLTNDLNNMKSVAKDAVYYINGEKNTSASNEIFLEKYKAGLTLNSADSSNQNIIFARDTENIANIIGAYINKISDFAEELKKKNDAHSNLTIDNLFNDLKKIDGALKQSGINVDYKKKTIDFDNTKFESALKVENNYAENIISGNAGLAAVVNKNLIDYLQTPVDLFALPNGSYESYMYIPTGYNIYNPYDVRNSSVRL